MTKPKYPEFGGDMIPIILVPDGIVCRYDDLLRVFLKQTEHIDDVRVFTIHIRNDLKELDVETQTGKEYLELWTKPPHTMDEK